MKVLLVHRFFGFFSDLRDVQDDGQAAWDAQDGEKSESDDQSVCVELDVSGVNLREGRECRDLSRG